MNLNWERILSPVEVGATQIYLRPGLYGSLFLRVLV